MLNRICLDGGIDLVNVVRKDEQETLLREMGAKYVVNSSKESFMADLTDAIHATGATLAFDATGGGTLASTILSAMEAAAARTPGRV
jgi:NADPH:quinone reductase-like Zn-dependent oxidoreductase